MTRIIRHCRNLNVDMEGGLGATSRFRAVFPVVAAYVSRLWPENRLRLLHQGRLY